MADLLGDFVGDPAVDLLSLSLVFDGDFFVGESATPFVVGGYNGDTRSRFILHLIFRQVFGNIRILTALCWLKSLLALSLSVSVKIKRYDVT